MLQTEIKETNILDLDVDSLVHCASRLSLCDIGNLAKTCRYLRDGVYADAVWESQNRIRWPTRLIQGEVFQFHGAREAFIARYSASQQFRFSDPLDWKFRMRGPISHVLFDNNFLIFAQGSTISKWEIGSTMKEPAIQETWTDHTARITCMRQYSLDELAFSRDSEGAKSLLVTSSNDHTIRVLGKSRGIRSQARTRTLRGHSGPVTTLADCLLGSGVLSSGGEDGTIRLWALLSSGGSKRGRSPLLATFHGHEQAVKHLVVAKHNPSLLISAAKDSKIRVWDASGSGACVGFTKGPRKPVGLICEGAVCYVAGDSTFSVLDVRSMQKVATVSAHKEGVLSFSMSVSISTICTGGSDKTAKLWDLRHCKDGMEPISVLSDHMGPVSCTNIDFYKAVTGGTEDRHVHIWDARTGDEINTLDSQEGQEEEEDQGVSAIAIDGTRISTATCGNNVSSLVYFRDFSDCSSSLHDTLHYTVSNNAEACSTSKFWNTNLNEDED